MGEPSLLKTALIGSAQASGNGGIQTTGSSYQSQQASGVRNQRWSAGNLRSLSSQASVSGIQPQALAQLGEPIECKGWLYKWTNYIKGYKKRWFVLENGYLSYYRNQTEVEHTCRGTINVMTGTVRPEDQLVIVVQNGATNVLHLKAPSEPDRDRWLKKLRLTRAHAAQLRSTVHLARGRSEDIDDEDEDEADLNAKEQEQRSGPALDKQLAMLSSKMDDLRSCFSVVCKHHADILHLLDSATVSTSPAGVPLPSQNVFKANLGDRHSNASASSGALSDKTGAVVANGREKELAAKVKQFKTASRAMVNACQEYYDTATQQGRRWQRLLEREHDQRVQFEGVVEQLARQQRQLERQAIRELKSASRQTPAPKSQSAAPVNGTATSFSRQQSTTSTNSRQLSKQPSSDSDDENDDFYDALDVEAPPVSAPFLSQGPSNCSSTAVKTSPSFDTLSTGSSQDSIGSLPLSSKVQGAKTCNGVQSGSKTSCKPTVHQRSQSDWTSSQQARADGAPLRSQSRLSVHSAAETDAVPDDADDVFADGPIVACPRDKPRRTVIPFKPSSNLNLWSIIKNCVGRELSKIPFPVNFSEPISMLQRLVEDLEYSRLLDLAAECSDPVEQMAYVAVFNISSYSSTAQRTSKPFNPLLGETFEMDRTGEPEFGWRLLAEQVSHHPPAAAFHCDSEKWVCFEELTLGSKFRGVYLQVQPLGFAHCEFKRDRNHYTWSRVTTMVNNIIVGKLWIDNIGECVVVNHTLGIRCQLKFVQYSFFHSDARRVVGVIKDRNGEARYILSGYWNEKMEGAWLKRPPSGTRNPYANLEPEGVPKIWQSINASDKKLLWRSNEFPQNSNKMYNFTTFAIQLNEEECGVAPTDSRMRPDQRLMEQAQWDSANVEKLRLEEKQRSARRAIEKANEQRVLNGLPPVDHEPAWFRRHRDPYTDQLIFKYTGQYWDCKHRGDWSKSPNIF